MVTISIIGLILAGVAQAKKLNDTDALEGIEIGKVVWDVIVSRPDRLLFYLKLTEETYNDLVRQEIEPDMIFIFHWRAA
jgi:hypothetical protein